MSHSHTLTGIYADIAQRVDALLEKKGAAKETDAVHEEAKDYLKILHAIFMKEWAVEEKGEIEEELLAHVNLLSERLCECVSTSFLPINHQEPTTLGVDISLGAVSLATLFAMVKREDVANALSEDSCFSIFKECAQRLVDSRLAPPSADTVLTDTCSQILRALNMILLKLAAVALPCTCLCSLIRVMGCVNSSTDNATATGTGTIALPYACARPVSKLIIRVITDEGKKESPFNWPTADHSRLLVAIHNYLTAQSHVGANSASNSESDDVPFRTVKTVLSQLVKAIGGPAIISLLSGMGISDGESIVRMTAKFSGSSATSTNNTTTSTSLATHPQDMSSPQLDGKVLCILEDIVASADKSEPIKQLYHFKKAHPSVDLDMYLSRISSFLRRFVLDAIAKLEDPQVAVGDENQRPTLPISPQESDPSTFKKQLTPQPPLATSPRAAQTDKIRGSLAGLTASLDLPNAASSNAAAAAGTLTRDGDLAARLAALKSRKN